MIFAIYLAVCYIAVLAMTVVLSPIPPEKRTTFRFLLVFAPIGFPFLLAVIVYATASVVWNDVLGDPKSRNSP